MMKMKNILTVFCLLSMCLTAKAKDVDYTKTCPAVFTGEFLGDSGQSPRCYFKVSCATHDKAGEAYGFAMYAVVAELQDSTKRMAFANSYSDFEYQEQSDAASVLIAKILNGIPDWTISESILKDSARACQSLRENQGEMAKTALVELIKNSWDYKE